MSVVPETDAGAAPDPGPALEPPPGPEPVPGPGIEGAPFVIAVFGVRWRIRPFDVPPEVTDTLRRVWSRAVALAEEPSHVDAEVLDYGLAPTMDVLERAGLPHEHRCLIGSEVEAVPYRVSRAITLASIMRRRGEALMLHAVGVSGPDGRTVALVAPSGTGKTTAATVLGRALGYVTDETVVIEADDRISPYPKPLSIITDSDRPHHKDESSPDELGLGPTPADPTLAAIVLLRRDAELGTPEFEYPPLVDALLAAIPETSALPAIPDPLDRLARALCRGGGPFMLRYAEISDCVETLTSLTRSDPERDAASATWEHHPRSVRAAAANVGTSTDTGVTWSSVVTRCGWDDAVTSEGETVILHDLVPSRLSRLGTALWLRADDPVDVPTLHRQIVADMGEHPRSEGLVLDGLQVLVDAGVLRIVADQPEPTNGPNYEPTQEPTREPTHDPGQPGMPQQPDHDPEPTAEPTHDPEQPGMPQRPDHDPQPPAEPTHDAGHLDVAARPTGAPAAEQ